MASSVTSAQLNTYRAHTYRLEAARQLSSEADAVEFVDERGFVFFWPIKGFELPSLWTAVAGDRPVASEHNDPGHVTWRWKDNLLGQKKWFYAKFLRGRATMISLQALPYFYALSDNYGDYYSDYLADYKAGRMTREAKSLFEALLDNGALDTLALRREAHLDGRGSHARFDSALTDLQIALRILPVGVVEAGAWRYAFVYELVDRHFPALAAQARSIGRGEARVHLVDVYLNSVGAATAADIAKLFRWPLADVRAACGTLVNQQKACCVPEVAGVKADWLAAPELFKD